MDLWLISQTENDGWDTYDSAVVAAETEEGAKHVHPHGSWGKGDILDCWCASPSQVKVKHLSSGYDGPIGVVLASFNAG